MDLAHLNDRGIVLVGCGRMGGALLHGWLNRGLAPGAVRVIDPNAPDWLEERGVATDGPLPSDPAVLVLAVKPQMMGGALEPLSQTVAAAQTGTLVLSVAAGVTIATFEQAFPGAAIVRAMPNTPAAIGQGISAVVGNARAGAAEMDLAETLMGAVGRVVGPDRSKGPGSGGSKRSGSRSSVGNGSGCRSRARPASDAGETKPTSAS